MKPVFVFGVGAQKAGTTWLYHTLKNQSFANFGFTKEFHIWDAKFSPLCRHFIASPQKDEDANRAMRRMMQTRSKVYAHYFSSLINDEISLTGDITPSYSLLKPQHFRHVKNLMETAGFDVKVVFLMRDPVARTWSSMRMQLRNADQKNPGQTKVTEDMLLANFEDDAMKPYHVKRTDYMATIQALESVFEPGQIQYEFYERLFSPKAITDLSEFLGVEIADYDFDKRVNVSQPIDLPADKIRFARNAYGPIYQGCYEKFPETREMWG